MDIIQHFIHAMEQGWLPDCLVSWGIRRLLARRKAESHTDDCEAWQSELSEFVASMRTGDVAFAQDKANEQHYELPAEFFETVLGPRLKYSSCQYDSPDTTLAEAENAMLKLTCERAGIQDGQAVLDFGCGWGAFSLYVAETFPNCRIRAISNSRVQGEQIRKRCAERGFDNVTVTTADAAEFDPGETFDRIVSVEMFEHLRNYEVLFRRVASWLNPGGYFFLHIFTHRCVAYPFDIKNESNWMSQYFFTGGMMPSHCLPLYFQADLKIDGHWAVDGRHYERTLRDWLAIMDRRKVDVMPILEATYGKENAVVWFNRWRVFFLACAELFGYKNGQEWWVSHYRFTPTANFESTHPTPQKMNQHSSTKPSLAVIGGGVAGIVAAYRLQDRFDITILERNDYLGGHTHTIPVPDGPDQGTPVDTGFIVFNDRTYPLFKEFLTDLDVSWRDTTMSFSFCDEISGFHYAGNGLNGLFSQRINLVNPFFWRMILEIRRFSRTAMAALDHDTLAGQSLGGFLEANHFSDYLRDRYVLPMGAAIWSTSPAEMLEFPAASMFHFWRNHGLLSLHNRPQWHTVEGGSHAYVQAFQKQFPGTIRLNAKICEVRRSDPTVEVKFENGEPETFDRVVIAAHADQAFAMLANPTEDEELLLKPWFYQANHAVLHTDIVALPPLQRAWACWNYCLEKDWAARNPVSVTYDMNLLQGLKTQAVYCVSLNRKSRIAEETVIADMNYDHPTYTAETMATQPKLPRLNKTGPVYFCGSYFGYGFHEDAVRSATEMVELVH